MSDGKNTLSGTPTVVRLDASARNEAISILVHAYRDEATFRYLFDHRKPGYQQRVRATVRELIDLYADDPPRGEAALRKQLSDWFGRHFATFDARLHDQLG